MKLDKTRYDRTWVDANASFYETFDRAQQKLQLKGEVIDGPSE